MTKISGPVIARFVGRMHVHADPQNPVALVDHRPIGLAARQAHPGLDPVQAARPHQIGTGGQQRIEMACRLGARPHRAEFDKARIGPGLAAGPAMADGKPVGPLGRDR